MALLAIGLGMQLRPRSRGRWLWRAGLAWAAVAVLAMTPMVANALVSWLESQHATAATCATSPPAVAVVLAGGVDTVPTDVADLPALAITSRRRIERAVEWWHQRPGRTLIIAGGPDLAGAIPTADLMADYARRLGVATTALQIEGRSASTWENAHALAQLQPALARRVGLVTSAIHLPRARYAMARAGFEVCAIPADPRRIPFGLPGYLIPRSSALHKTEAALHELVGLAYYRWLDMRSAPAAVPGATVKPAD